MDDPPDLVPSPRINNRFQFARDGQWMSGETTHGALSSSNDLDSMELPTRNVHTFARKSTKNIEFVRTCTARHKTHQITSAENFPCLRMWAAIRMKLFAYGGAAARRGIFFEKSLPCLLRIICHAAAGVSAHSFQRVPRQ